MVKAEDLAQAGARCLQVGNQRAWASIAYDSRLAQPGELFVALQTERGDGHGFIHDALKAGATAVLCATPPEGLAPEITLWQADDPLKTLVRWAALRLAAVAPTTIAVTGSVGKTSTKHALATLLEGIGPTFRSPRSFNGPLGLAVGMARLRDEDRWAVLEFGTDAPGDIPELSALFPPRVGVVTAVGAAHLAALKSLDGVAAEKGALVRVLPSAGWAVLNGDDARVRAMATQTEAWVLTFGSGPHCDLWYEQVALSAQGTRFRLCGHGEGQPPRQAARHGAHGWAVDVEIPMLGEPSVRAVTAALAAAQACGLDIETALERLSALHPTAGRLRALPLRGGGVLIDDSFNAAPPSMRAALDTLAALPAKRRIAIVGEMADLGDASAELHAQLGAHAASIADLLITKGDRAMPLAQAAKAAAAEQGRALQVVPVYTAAAAIAALPSDLGPEDVVLVKGSAEARMERVAAGLLAPDADPGAVLVRQERAWRSVRVGVADRPTTLSIDLDALAGNVRRLKALTETPLMAVLKADAYGHGAIRAARTVLQAGAAALAVATLGEAVQLRKADIAAPILILGYTPPWQSAAAIADTIETTIFDLASAQALATAAQQRGTTARVHVKVDTGMTRLGLLPAEVGPFLAQLRELSHLEVRGLFTHFATSDSPDSAFFHRQHSQFEALVGELRGAGLCPPIVHAANTAAAIRYPEARYDLVRIGIGLYGLDPDPLCALPVGIKPVLSFNTEVAQMRTVAAGTAVSYGCTFVAERPTAIATIPVGYADGFRRAPTGWREVLIHGKRAPVVGRVCMDYAMIDVSACGEVRRGDPVVLIGHQGEDSISAAEVASWLGTSVYEVVATILPRVPREVA